MVQNPIDVMEDVPPGDVLVAVMPAKVLQRPVGDVFAPIRAVFVVGVERKALSARPRTDQVKVGNRCTRQSHKWFFGARRGNSKYAILCFGCVGGKDTRVD